LTFGEVLADLASRFRQWLANLFDQLAVGQFVG
jgi:hypothetical protein